MLLFHYYWTLFFKGVVTRDKIVLKIRSVVSLKIFYIKLSLPSTKHFQAMREACYGFQVAAYNPENYFESLQSPNL
jgi:hypothetical protein